MSALTQSVQRFTSRARRLQKCCARVEAELAHGRIKVTDVELVYSSSFLSIVARWEAFLEEALLEAVCGPASTAIANGRLIQVGSKAQLRDIILFPDLDYVSIPTVKKAKQLYGLFLKESRPVSSISEANQQYVQQAIWIRNAIAHESEFAARMFREKVPGVASLPVNRRRPACFLRHEFRAAPSQRRIELYCAALLSAAAEMEANWV